MNKLKLSALTMALCMVMSLVGCSPASAPSSTPTSVTAIQTISGTVEDAGMSTLTIVCDDGKTYTLLREDATVESSNGLLIGDHVDVTFTGDIAKGAQATNIAVAEAAHTAVSGVVVDETETSFTIQLPSGNNYTFARSGVQVSGGELALGDVVEVTYTGELETEPQAVAVNITLAVDGVITGVISHATMNGISIKLSNGNQYFFSKAEAIVHGIDGIKLGETVEIAYTGHLEDTPSAVLIEILAAPTADPIPASSSSVAPSSSSAAPAPKPQVKSISGKITDITSNTMSIYSKGGNNYTFARKSAVLVSDNGSLTVGDSVDISYTGVASRSPVATKIKVTAYAADAVSTFTGIIDDATNTKLMLENKRGDIYTFYSLQYADVYHDEDVYIGDKVSIKYTGSIGRGPEVTYIRVLESSSVNAHESSNRISSMSGTVVDATSSSVSVTDSRGNSYLFARDGAQITGGSLLVGDTVTVRYTGTLGNSPQAVSIEVTRSAPVESGGTMNGTITEATMSTLILADANGNAFIFSRENATISGGSLVEGLSASVTYTGELGSTPEATFIQILS